MNNLYEALENCLRDIEHGADIDTVLFRYPDLAEELRPILEASVAAKNIAVPTPSAEVVRRNRAKVLQHAAQMREAKVKSSKRIWFASLRRIAVTLAVFTVFFMSGTSLVGASSNTLPGDNLYPVKRTWEGLRLLFTLNPQEHKTLEVEHENERLHELNVLFAEGRSEAVEFKGLVTSQSRNEWVVSGVRVLISSQTDIRDQAIVIGSPISIRGLTQGSNIVLAERIRLLSANENLPDIEDEHEVESESGNDSGSGDDAPDIEVTQTPETESENENGNSNSGNGNDSGPNENQNENGGDDGHSNDNSGNSNEDQDSNDNSSNEYINNDNSDNDNGSHDHENNNNSGNDDSGGSNDNSNDNGGDDHQSNDNGNDSGGGGND